jgi:glutathione peroxidase
MRWLLITLLAGVLAMLAAGQQGSNPPAQKQDPATTVPAKSVYQIKVEPMKEASTAPVTGDTLAPYQGKVLLIVNVASKCGYTPQYEGLEALYKKYQKQGLQLVGFPSNDFREQEPGTEKEIVQFCTSKYGVTFPLYAKLHAVGPPEPAPLYQYLTQAVSEDKGPVKWNFEKFLVSRDGKIVARFRSAIKPDDPKLVKAIEAELAKPAPTATAK